MDVYRMEGDALGAEPIFRKDTLANADQVISRQAADTVHVHPNGRVLYGVNRADTTREFEGKRVFVGGEKHAGGAVVISGAAPHAPQAVTVYPPAMRGTRWTSLSALSGT
jgi:hypothetical protein